MRSTPAANAAMRRRPVLERAVETAEPFLDVGWSSRDLEGLDHHLGQLVADAAGRDLEAVADDVVLERLDRQRSPPCSASMPP